MGVKEDFGDEIYNERAQYLSNMDELMLEIYDEKKTDMTGSPYIWDVGGINLVNKIVEDPLFASWEYKTFIQLTNPDLMAKRKIQPMSLTKLDDDEYQDICSIKEE